MLVGVAAQALWGHTEISVIEILHANIFSQGRGNVLSLVALIAGRFSVRT